MYIHYLLLKPYTTPRLVERRGLLPPTTAAVRVTPPNGETCNCSYCSRPARWMLKDALQLRSRQNHGHLLTDGSWKLLPSIEYMQIDRPIEVLNELYNCLNYITLNKNNELVLTRALELIAELKMLGFATELLANGRIVGAHNETKLTKPPTPSQPKVVEIPNCPLCNGAGLIKSPPIERWTHTEDLKEAAPTLSLAAREYLILHTCKKCWEGMFPPDGEIYKW